MANIVKRGKNSWRLVVELGYDANGKRIRRTKTIRVTDETLLRTTKRLRDYLQRELAKFQAEVESGEYIAPEKMTFEEFIENHWRPKYAEKGRANGGLSARTFDNYYGHLRSRIIPFFGNRYLGEIKTLHIVDFFDRLEKDRKDGKGDKLSGSTMLYIFKVLKNVFSKAVEWKVISKNPMDGLKQPKASDFEPQFYSESEARTLVLALMKEPKKWQLYFLGCIFGGYRRGEMNALQWKHVDFVRGGFHIQESITTKRRGQIIVESPKTKASKGFVDMPGWYMREMQKFRVEWEEERKLLGDRWQGGEQEYVFHRGDGQPFHPSTPTGTWRKFLKKNGLRPIRLHDLRHTMGSLLLDDDVDLKAIQERLRHAKLSTTSDIYLHLTREKKKRIAEKFDKFDPEKIGHQLDTNSEKTEIIARQSQ